MSKIKTIKQKKVIKEASEDFDLDALDNLGTQFDGDKTSAEEIAAATYDAKKDAEKEANLGKVRRKRGELQPDNAVMINRWSKLYDGMSEEEIDQFEKTAKAIEDDSNGTDTITINDAFLKDSTKRTFASNLVKSREFTTDEKYILCLLMGIPLTWVTGSEVPLEVIGKMVGLTKQGVYLACERAVKKMQRKLQINKN